MVSIKWIKASGISVIILNMIINRKVSKAPCHPFLMLPPELSRLPNIAEKWGDSEFAWPQKRKVLHPVHNNRTWCHWSCGAVITAVSEWYNMKDWRLQCCVSTYQSAWLASSSCILQGAPYTSVHVYLKHSKASSWVSLCSRNTLGLHFGCGQFESWLVHQLPRVLLWGISSVPTSKLLESTVIRSKLFPLKLFPIHHLLVSLPFYIK
jgi:hypothetical protein